MHRDTSGWIRQYEGKDALWIHNGDPTCPHALLTSGNHSDGFFNSRLVIPDEMLLRQAASDLVELYVNAGGIPSRVDTVVGPQTGATKLAELICEQIHVWTEDVCTWASPAKSFAGREKQMVFTKDQLEHLPGRLVLLCEDVMTTGGSVELTAQAVMKAGGALLPYTLVLVNRSGLKEAHGRKIISLIDRHMPMWPPDDCPLCRQGSKAIPPKGENWALLKARY